MRQSKFNFVPLHQEVPKEQVARVTVETKYGKVRFLKDKMFPELQEKVINKFIRFYIDKEKKTLAWRLFEEGTLDDLKMYKKITTTTNAAGTLVITSDINIKRLFPEGKTYKNLEVKEYKAQRLLESNTFYYVTLD